jgi:hypothetical protein
MSAPATPMGAGMAHWTAPGTGSAPSGQRQAPTPPASPPGLYDAGDPGVLCPDDIGVPE